MFASEELKGDWAIVLKAMEQDGCALVYASDELLLDSAFASDAKKQGIILKLSLLSGRYTCQFIPLVDKFTTDD
eukprot:5726012-Amphidinium_carterae.1